MKRLSGAVVFVCAVGIIAVLASFPPHASSATVVDTLQGYAWSSNVGWICFYDLATPSNCGSASVQVNSNNTLSGYAWSNEAGWISFNSADTASCGSAATYNPSTGALSGWARALDGVDSDGCISLSGTAQDSTPYGVSFANGQGAGYAWASDVFGWISFWGSNYGVTLAPIDVCSNIPGTQSSWSDPNGYISGGQCLCNNGYTLSGTQCVVTPPPSASIGSFSATPTRVQKGNQTSLSWSTTGMTSCTVTDQNNNLISTALSSTGTSATVNQATTYTLSCSDGTNNYSSNITVGIVPTYREL